MKWWFRVEQNLFDTRIQEYLKSTTFIMLQWIVIWFIECESIQCEYIESIWMSQSIDWIGI